MDTKTLVVGEKVLVRNTLTGQSFEVKVVKVNPLGTVFAENDLGHSCRFDANGYGGEDELEGGSWWIVDPQPAKFEHTFEHTCVDQAHAPCPACKWTEERWQLNIPMDPVEATKLPPYDHTCCPACRYEEGLAYMRKRGIKLPSIQQGPGSL
jgi:hypothetical protein